MASKSAKKRLANYKANNKAISKAYQLDKIERLKSKLDKRRLD